jgi:hypothetical protein
VSKSLNTIDQDDRDIIAIEVKKSAIAFNVYLVKRIFVVTASKVNSFFCLVAKVTARTGV